eukprot:10493256-Ditylum_brightwellii.AAC.1
MGDVNAFLMVEHCRHISSKGSSMLAEVFPLDISRNCSPVFSALFLEPESTMIQVDAFINWSIPHLFIVAMVSGVLKIKSMALDPSACVFGTSMQCVAPMVSHIPVSARNGAKSLSLSPELASTRRRTLPSCFHLLYREATES